MNILAYSLGRVIRSFNADEMYPEKGFYLPLFIRRIGERYVFTDIPELNQNSLTFKQGSIMCNGELKVVSTMTIFNDAVVIESTRTEDAEIVMDEFVAWMQSTQGFRQPKTPSLTLYESHLIVDFEEPASTAIKAFEKFGSIYGKAFEETYGKSITLELSHIGLSADPTKLPRDIHPLMKVESSIS